MPDYQFAHRGKEKSVSTNAVATGDASGEDWLDAVCDSATHTLCPVPKSLPVEAFNKTEGEDQQPDLLDRIFEGYDGGNPQLDNKSVVDGSDPSVVAGLTHGNDSISSRLALNNILSFGSGDEDKDALDRIFESVESATCGNDEEDEPPVQDLEVAPPAQENPAANDVPKDVETGHVIRSRKVDRSDLSESKSLAFKQDNKVSWKICAAVTNVILIVVIIILIVRAV